MTVPVFHFLPSADEAMGQTLIHETNILVSRDQHEQRIRRRVLPRRGVEFTIVTVRAEETAAVMAILAQNQAGLVYVPQWWYASPLTTDEGIASTNLGVDTTDREFVPNTWAIVWRDTTYWEKVDTGAVTASSIICSGLTKSYFAGRAYVVPLLVMRWIPSADYRKLARSIGAFPLVFETPNAGLTNSG